MKFSGAEIIVKLLENEGIEMVAGIPGGANLPLYDAFYRSRIKHILARHEQGAGFIAQGMARVTGKPAVCLATSGPGATNLLTAIADAKLDSIPIIAITGQVPVGLIGTDGFQEVDTYGMTIPITKHNFLVREAAELLKVIPEAFRLASTGRPGPILIDVPKDVQKEIIEVKSWPAPFKAEEPAPIEKSLIREAARMIKRAKRPVIYAGGGIIHAGAAPLLLELAEQGQIPVCSSLMGLGSFPTDHPLFLGMLGMHGAPYTNFVMNESDLIIALGSRFDDRATGRVNSFCPRADIIHVDIDRAELNKIKMACLGIQGHLGSFLEALLPMIEREEHSEWLDFISASRAENSLPLPSEEEGLHPLNFIRKLGERVGGETIVTTDVGQHQMWTAQVYPFRQPRTFLTSGGLGTMGFGLPAAIGAALAAPEKMVVSICGDGSFQMNFQELALLAELNLNVKIFILNNNHLGLVRQQQDMFFDRNYMACSFQVNPDFAALAEVFKVKGYNLAGVDDPEALIEEALSYEGPVLVEIPVDCQEHVLPIVPSGASNIEMVMGSR